VNSYEKTVLSTKEHESLESFLIPMKRYSCSFVTGCLFFVFLFYPISASAILVFREDFDTPTALINENYDTRYSESQIQNGNLVLFYVTATNSEPSGVECRLPSVGKSPDVRRIVLHFGESGSEMSNSLFISYAIGPGRGLSLVPFPYGKLSNIRSGPRTGYILRFLRHGDGTNEMEIYRNDTGWVDKLKNVWIPSNPVKTLRRVEITHRKSGDHTITTSFDTGSRYEYTVGFHDDAYPPGDIQRGLQVTGKAHSGIAAAGEVRLQTDTWTVEDEYISTEPSGNTRLKKNRMPKEEPGNENTPSNLGQKKYDSASSLASAFAEARVLFEKSDSLAARAIVLDILSMDSAHADALELLGMIEMASQKYSSANNCLSRALALRQAVLGRAHPKAADSMDRLAQLYESCSKDPADVERLYEDAWRIRAQAYGVEDPRVVISLKELANLYISQGKNTEARKLLNTAVRILETAHGPHHIDIADNLNLLARTYRVYGHFSAAEKLYLRELAIKEKYYGPDHPVVQACVYNLSYFYMAFAQYAKAEPFEQRLLGMLEKTLDFGHPEIGGRFYNLGFIASSKGQYPEAENYYRKALAIREKALGPGHTFTATTLSNLAYVLSMLKRYDEAARMYRRAIGITEKEMGMDHPHLSDYLNNLGVIYIEQSRFGDAEPLLKRALVIKEKTAGKESPELNGILGHLSMLCRKTGRPMEADFYAHRVQEIKNGGP